MFVLYTELQMGNLQ